MQQRIGLALIIASAIGILFILFNWVTEEGTNGE